MAALPDLITVAQFRESPEGSDFTYELHHGEVVAVTRPKARHSELQHRLFELLKPKLANFGVIRIEFPFRPLAEFDLRAADVAAISRERSAAIDPDDNLRGAPDLVIEVKSPSNTRQHLQELVTLCLCSGSIECWIVDPDQRTVTVIRSEGDAIVHSAGGRIPLSSFADCELPVDEIFA